MQSENVPWNLGIAIHKGPRKEVSQSLDSVRMNTCSGRNSNADRHESTGVNECMHVCIDSET